MRRKHTWPESHPGHYLREWRVFHGLALQAVVDRVGELADERAIPRTRIGLTHGNLSRIERGKVPYNQHLLDLLALVYRTDVPSLIWRKPDDPDGLWAVWDKLGDEQRAQVVEIAKTFKKGA